MATSRLNCLQSQQRNLTERSQPLEVPYQRQGPSLFELAQRKTASPLGSDPNLSSDLPLGTFVASAPALMIEADQAERTQKRNAMYHLEWLESIREKKKRKVADMGGKLLGWCSVTGDEPTTPNDMRTARGTDVAQPEGGPHGEATKPRTSAGRAGSSPPPISMLPAKRTTPPAPSQIMTPPLTPAPTTLLPIPASAPLVALPSESTSKPMLHVRMPSALQRASLLPSDPSGTVIADLTSDPAWASTESITACEPASIIDLRGPRRINRSTARKQLHTQMKKEKAHRNIESIGTRVECGEEDEGETMEEDECQDGRSPNPITSTYRHAKDHAACQQLLDAIHSELTMQGYMYARQVKSLLRRVETLEKELRVERENNVTAHDMLAAYQAVYLAEGEGGPGGKGQEGIGIFRK